MSNSYLENIYSIGTEVGDFKIINHIRKYYSSGSKLILICKCNICNNIKKVAASDIKKYPGVVSHKTCNRHKYNGLATGPYARFHKIWYDIINRCYNHKNEAFNLYGGRGITTEYDDNNKGYLGFLNDHYDSYMKHVALYGEHNTTIDRIDCNKGYYKDNIRWATYEEQIQNRRNMGNFIAIGPDDTLYISNNQSKFCAEFNIPRCEVWYCVNNIHTSYKGWRFYIPDILFQFDFSKINVIYKLY